MKDDIVKTDEDMKILLDKLMNSRDGIRKKLLPGGPGRKQ